ncbi:hypothetical protein BDV12DRAFT_203891 [Aspergillus spectabilis]
MRFFTLLVALVPLARASPAITSDGTTPPEWKPTTGPMGGRPIPDPNRLLVLHAMHDEANLTKHSTVLDKHEKRVFQVFGLLGVNLLTGLVAEALQEVLDALLDSFTSDDIIWTNQENCRAHFTTQGGGNENFRTYAKDHGDPTAEEWKN